MNQGKKAIKSFRMNRGKKAVIMVSELPVKCPTGRSLNGCLGRGWERSLQCTRMKDVERARLSVCTKKKLANQCSRKTPPLCGEPRVANFVILGLSEV